MRRRRRRRLQETDLLIRTLDPSVNPLLQALEYISKETKIRLREIATVASEITQPTPSLLSHACVVADCDSRKVPSVLEVVTEIRSVVSYVAPPCPAQYLKCGGSLVLLWCVVGR